MNDDATRPPSFAPGGRMPADAVTVSGIGGGVPAHAGSGPPQLAGGQQFGAYRILRLLGRGGMGEVYEAEEASSGRRVALKLFNRSLADPVERERFLREGQLAAAVSHPRCVYIFGTDEIHGIPVLAMELVSGGTLKDVVQERGPLPPGEAVDIILQVVDGLEAASTAGVLHRDVKPANCFLERDGTVKVGDFGLSTSLLARDETQLTLAGTVLGTPGYAAPEQLRAEKADVRADIYAVGATLYYLLTGRPPFESANLVALVAMVLQETPPAPRALQPTIAAGLSAVVMRCLAKKADDRPQGYDELRRLLLPFGSLAPTPALLGLRCAANVVDIVAAMLLGAPLSLSMVRSGIAAEVHGSVGFSDARLWTIMLASHLLTILYYGVSEGIWGASIGKAVLGLRVIHRRRLAPPGLWRGLARAAIWSTSSSATQLTVYLLMGPAAAMTSFSPGLRVVQMLGPAFGVAVMLASMRRRNGFAGLHELATGTRVVSRHAVATRNARVRGFAPQPVAPHGSERIGPYRVIARQATADGRELVSAVDDQLRRRVWVRPVPPGQAPLSAARRESAAPARARWLTGSRTPGDSWDAFEAWDGEPLIASAMPAPWSRVRGWLADLTGALEASRASDDCPPLALDRVWIAADDGAKLLDWPAPGVTPARTADVAGGASRFADEQRFLHAVAMRALVGPDQSGSLPVGPLHAAHILDRLRRSEFADSAELMTALRAAEGRPHAVSWRRPLHLALSGVPPLLVTFIVLVVLFARADVYRGRPDTSLLSACLRRLERLEVGQGGISPQSVQDERRALEIFIAGRLRAAVADPVLRTPFGQMRVPHLARAERILASNPQVSAEDLRQARITLQRFLADAERQAAEDAIGGIHPDDIVGFAILMIAFVAAPSVVGAFAFRGGWLLRGLGLGIATAGGAEASRVRTGIRALIAWSPILAAFPLFFLTGGGLGHAAPSSFVTAVVALLLLLFPAGVVVAAVKPSRGLQDRIAGTWIVPR